MEMVFRGRESPGPGFFHSAQTHHKGRPRKRKLESENASPCTDLPVTMGMTAATLGKHFYKQNVFFIINL